MPQELRRRVGVTLDTSEFASFLPRVVPSSRRSAQDAGGRCPGFCVRPTLGRMTSNYQTTWYADDAGYQVIVSQRARIVRNYRVESLAGESLESVRQRAREKAVELALQFRVPLTAVAEAHDRYGV